MATTVTLTRVDRPTSGAFLISFSDSNSVDQPDLASLTNWANGDASGDQDLCHRLLVRYWLARDATAANDNLVEGKTITFDVAQNGPVVDIS